MSLNPIDTLLIDYIFIQNKSTNHWSYEVDLSFLKLLSKLIGHYVTTNNIDLFKQLVQFDGRLWKNRFSQNSRLIQETLAIFKTLIVIKSIPIVQQVYNSIVQDAELALDLIIKSNSTTNLNNQQESETNPEINIKEQTNAFQQQQVN